MVKDTIIESAKMVDSIAQESLKLVDEATSNQQTSYEEIEMRKAMNMARKITTNTIKVATHSIPNNWGSGSSWGSNSKSIEEEHLC